MLYTFWEQPINETPNKPTQTQNAHHTQKPDPTLPIFTARYWYNKLNPLPARYLRNLTFALNRTLPFEEQYSNYQISNAEPNQLISTLLEHVHWLNTNNLTKLAKQTPGASLQLQAQGFSTNLTQLNQIQLRSLASYLEVNNTTPKKDGVKARWGKQKLITATAQAIQNNYTKSTTLIHLNNLTDQQLQQLATQTGHYNPEKLLTREQLIETLLTEEQWA